MAGMGEYGYEANGDGVIILSSGISAYGVVSMSWSGGHALAVLTLGSGLLVAAAFLKSKIIFH